ncbi:elongation factor P 5-aminopentanone reductase [Lawsonibacter sp. LCP25S3_G6]|uniref:elongation factor P 5-aminopentanone reductase n=1 Tax=unclassified Lawsonibacter TaxID=2617946 RepID=UPI003F9BC290
MERHVLITGASRGIGAATARRFAQGGWQVSIHYHKSLPQAQALAEELTRMGSRAVLVQGDVSDPEQARQLVEQAQQALGPLDAVVCNAGIALPIQLLTDTTDLQWRQVMGTDLDGVFHVLRSAIPGMVSRKAGSIVTVSSMWGVTGGSCEAPYSAAKAGVVGLTRALAKELGPSHIRVNCVAPGAIETEMTAFLTQEDREALAEETPLGRMGTAEEVADAIYFLAGEQARFITGQVLCVDGGMVI